LKKPSLIRRTQKFDIVLIIIKGRCHVSEFWNIDYGDK
jgi:hypothetical protein